MKAWGLETKPSCKCRQAAVPHWHVDPKGFLPSSPLGEACRGTRSQRPQGSCSIPAHSQKEVASYFCHYYSYYCSYDYSMSILTIITTIMITSMKSIRCISIVVGLGPVPKNCLEPLTQRRHG